jgi:hypothetical protein
MCLRARAFALLGCCTIFNCRHAPPDRPPTTPRPTTAAAATPPSITDTIAALIEPLQRNPWAGWKTTTRVTVKSIDDRADAERAYVQPDLIYVVEAQDRRLARLQEVDGKMARQEFPVTNQPGVPVAAETGEGRPAEISIDGVALPATLYENTVEWIGPDSGGASTTSSWVLRDGPHILLRRQEGDDWWAITSLKAERRIGDRTYRCVEITNRMGMVDGYVIQTQCLNAAVPGHVIETIKKFFKPRTRPDSKPWLAIHEKVSSVEVPGH